jgi:hypothetical protein
MLTVIAKHPSTPTEQELLTVSRDMGDILIAGIRQAPVVSNFYSQVAAAMVQAAAAVNGAYPPVLKAAFVRRGILSLSSAAAADAPAKRTTHDSDGPLTRIAIDGSAYGLGGQQLLVYAASHPRSVSVSAAGPGGGEIAPASAEVAAKAFVEQLFRRGRVDVGRHAGGGKTFASPHTLKTHRLVAMGEAVALERVLFDCGLCSH